MALPREQIDAEKARKSRPDLLPASALMAAGRVMAYGLAKHGECTWRVAGTKQAESREHVASMVRHALEVAANIDAIDDESGLEQLACVITQACIAYDCRVAERARHGASAYAPGQVEGEEPRGCVCPTPGLCHIEQRCMRGLR
jgi:hypothetical protein